MITSLFLTNFKTLSSVSIKDITRVALIGGRNNCGKTTLLEAIYMLFDMFDPNIITKQLSWRGVNFIPAEPDIMWGPIFHNFDLNKNVEISATWKSKQRSLRIAYKKDARRQVQQIAQPLPGLLGRNIIPTQQTTVIPDTLDLIFSEGTKEICKSHLYSSNNGLELNIEKPPSSSPVKATMLPARSRANPEEEAERFGRIDIDGKVDEILKFLQLVEPSIKSLSFVRIGNTSWIYADVGITKKVPINYMGDGISRLTSLLLSIANNRNGLVLVDEIENGIHYSVLTSIWKALIAAANEYNCQIIATTHSHECLNAAYLASNEIGSSDLSYIRLQNRGGKIIGNTFSTELLGSAIEADMEIR